MRVLVLGADGFVGRHLIAALAARDGIDPIAARRRPRVAHDGAAALTLDACDAEAVARACAGADAVVSLVAGDGDTIQRAADVLAGAAGRTGVRVVHLSSMAVYGAATGLIGEDAPLRGEGGYGEAKVAAEHALSALPGSMLLRPGCVYGGGSPQWTARLARLLRARRIGDLGAAGDGCSNIVHVRDVVAAIVAALEDPGASGAYNLAMPDAPDWNGYLVAFARAIGAVPVARIPEWRVAIETRLAAPPLEIARRVLGDGRLPPPIPPSLARLWRQDIRLDPRRATDGLRLRFMPLADGLREAAASIAA